MTLHRRAFLVLPNLDLTDSTIQALSPLQFHSAFDISVRTTMTSANTWARLPNSLEDLALRENRIAHDVSGSYPLLNTPNRQFPSLFWRGLLAPQGAVPTPGLDNQWGVAGVDDDGNGTIDDVSEAGHFGSDDLMRPIDLAAPPWPPSLVSREVYAESYGSDVVLTNLAAFDVRAYDPTVPIYQAVPGSDPVLPGDPGYGDAMTGSPTPLGNGGYVDLFYRRYVGGGSSVFSDPPLPRSGMQLYLPVFWGQQQFPAVYDTWSLDYERNGIDEDGLLVGVGGGTTTVTVSIRAVTTTRHRRSWRRRVRLRRPRRGPRVSFRVFPSLLGWRSDRHPKPVSWLTPGLRLSLVAYVAQFSYII